MFKTLLISYLCLGILSCESADKLQRHIKDYQSRMANVLEVAPANLPAISLPSYPSLKSLDAQHAEYNIKLFEFYQLKHCALYTLVAERNTSLGRLQLPSTRYLYERALLTALADCIEQTTEPSLKDNLQKWYAAKQLNIGAAWANLMQSSSELKRALSGNTSAIKGDKSDGLTQTQQALTYLVQINQDKQPDGAELEKHLKHLNNNPLPAKLWFSQLLLSAHLNELTLWLTENTVNLRCDAGPSKKKIEYLSNVFQLFFIEKIQPIAGQVNHYHYQLGPIFEQIMQQAALSVAYKDYIQTSEQQGFTEYQQAMKQHIHFWQRLFKRCNLSPQKN